MTENENISENEHTKHGNNSLIFQNNLRRKHLTWVENITSGVASQNSYTCHIKWSKWSSGQNLVRLQKTWKT